VDFAKIVLLEPWSHVHDGKGLEAELARELPPGHRLFGRKVRAVARRVDRDDFLFVVEPVDRSGPFRAAPPEWALVHLTWSKETDPRWPSTEMYPSIEAWIEDCMKPDHEDRLDDPRPRSLAMEFRCTRDLAAIHALLREDPRAIWAMRDGHLRATDGGTEVRIFVEDPGFMMQIDRRDGGDANDGWYDRALEIGVAFLRRIGATHAESCYPDRE
jgi:hypothetical protein